MAESIDHKTLSDRFLEVLNEWFEIENSTLSSNDKDLQKRITRVIESLEQMTVQVSYFGLFSINETLEDISTESIKFLLLPALLGFLTLKKIATNKENDLEVSLAYFKDFLKRCSSYELTNFQIPQSEDSIDQKDIKENRKPTAEELRMMGKEREKKIARYKEKIELEKKLDALKSAVKNCSDDEVIRDYFVTLVRHFIHKSIDELDSISMEQKLLKHRSTLDKQDKEVETAPPRPLRPFLITKDNIQKKVFGAGYPSLPMMSVEEFYEQRVKDGWFPPPNSAQPFVVSGQEEQPPAEQDEKEDEEQSRENLMRRDEWKDTHRRGWGNTYNRS